MMSVGIDFRPADAAMGTDEWSSDPKTNRDAELIVAQSKPEVTSWQRVQP
jgi:hypothetical protein